MAIIHELNGTELRYGKVSNGLVLIMRKGHTSISLPLNFDDVEHLIKILKDENTLFRVGGTLRDEVRSESRKLRDRHKDK